MDEIVRSVDQQKLTYLVTVRVKDDGDYPVSIFGVRDFYGAVQEALDSFPHDAREDLEIIRVEVV